MRIVTLEDICTTTTSSLTLKELEKNEGIYPLYGASGLIKYIDFYKQEKEYIGIVKDGAGIGRIMFLPKNSSVLGTVQYIFPNKNIDIKYLYFNLIKMNLKKYYSGSTIPHIYFKDYKKEKIKLYDLAKQKKIVKILENISEIIEKKKNKLQEYNKLSKCLFIEMFGNPVLNERNWRIDTCKNISIKIGSGSTPKGGEKSYQTKGITFIRSMNVYNNNFSYKDLAFISEEQGRKLSNVEVEREDILLNITGASVARCCIVPENILPARVNQHVSIIRCKKDIVNTIFLCYQFTTKEYQDFLWKLATSNGATREALTKQQEENLKVIIPPVELQNQFAERIKLIEKSKFIIGKNFKSFLSIQNYLFYLS